MEPAESRVAYSMQARPPQKQVFFSGPFPLFSSPSSPLRPHPHMGGAPKTGGGFDARAVYGEPCTALGNEGRASPRETLAGAARGRGKGASQRQPLMTMNHMAIHSLTKIHDTHEPTKPILPFIHHYSLPLLTRKEVPVPPAPMAYSRIHASAP